MAVRFYVDADTLGLAQILVNIRWDVTYPGDPGGTVKRHTRPACSVTQTGLLDEEWIPVVAAQDWLILSRDKHIERRPAELAAIQANSARLVAISSDEKLDNFRILEVVMTQWRRIEALLEVPGPFIYRCTRTSFNRAV